MFIIILGIVVIFLASAVSKVESPFREHTGTIRIVGILIFIVLFLFIIIRNNEKNTVGELKFYNCIDYGLIFILIPLFNPNGWLHNFSTLIFPSMLVVYYLIVCNFKDKSVLLLLILYFLLSSIGSQSLVGESMQAIFERFSAVAFGSLFLFAALVMIKFKSIISIYKEY